jgi:transposase-like protein
VQLTCLFCFKSQVRVAGQTVRGGRALTEYRCDHCQRTWVEVSRGSQAAEYSPMPGTTPAERIDSAQ